MANYITGSSVVEASGFTANVGCVSIRKELKLCIDTVPCKGAILALMLKVEGVFGTALMRCRGQPLDTEDAAVAALRYKSGALGTISSGYYNQGGKFPSKCTD